MYCVDNITTLRINCVSLLQILVYVLFIVMQLNLACQLSFVNALAHITITITIINTFRLRMDTSCAVLELGDFHLQVIS